MYAFKKLKISIIQHLKKISFEKNLLWSTYLASSLTNRKTPEAKQSFTCVLLAIVTTSQDFNSTSITSLGVEILLQNSPQAGRQFGKPKDLSTWTITNLLQVFYGHLVQCNNKNLTCCPFRPREFVLPFNIWANYSLKQLHSTFFFSPRTSRCKPQHTAPPLLSLPAVTVHQPPHLMMMMSWPQADSATAQLEQEKNIVRMQEEKAKKNMKNEHKCREISLKIWEHKVAHCIKWCPGIIGHR